MINDSQAAAHQKNGQTPAELSPPPLRKRKASSTDDISQYSPASEKSKSDITFTNSNTSNINNNITQINSTKIEEEYENCTQLLQENQSIMDSINNNLSRGFASNNIPLMMKFQNNVNIILSSFSNIPGTKQLPPLPGTLNAETYKGKTNTTTTATTMNTTSTNKPNLSTSITSPNLVSIATPIETRNKLHSNTSNTNLLSK